MLQYCLSLDPLPTTGISPFPFNVHFQFMAISATSFPHSLSFHLLPIPALGSVLVGFLYDLYDPYGLHDQYDQYDLYDQYDQYDQHDQYVMKNMIYMINMIYQVYDPYDLHYQYDRYDLYDLYDL